MFWNKVDEPVKGHISDGFVKSDEIKFGFRRTLFP
jgi:hypothetical protein